VAEERGGAGGVAKGSVDRGRSRKGGDRVRGRGEVVVE